MKNPVKEKQLINDISTVFNDHVKYSIRNVKFVAQASAPVFHDLNNRIWDLIDEQGDRDTDPRLLNVARELQNMPDQDFESGDMVGRTFEKAFNAVKTNTKNAGKRRLGL